MFLVFLIVLSIFGTGDLIPPDTTPPDYAAEEFDTVSGGDYFPDPTFSASSNTAELQDEIGLLLEQTTQLQDDIELYASGSGSAAEAYLSSTIIDVMERVVNARPFCKYVAYRTSYEDSNAGTLVYGTSAQVSNGLITLQHASLVQYYRYRPYNSASWEYRYTVTPMDSYTVSYGSNTLLYTNVLQGYPTLGYNYSGILVLVLVALAVIFVFKRGD